MTATSLFLAALALGPLASPSNDPITLLMRTGDPVPGVGNLGGWSDGSVNDSGAWVLSAVASTPVGPARVVLVDGNVVLQQGQVLAGGTFQQASPGVQIDGQGHSLVGVAGGLYLDATPLVLPGDPASAAGFGPGSTYVFVSDVSIEGTGAALLRAFVDDPGVGQRKVLLTITYDSAGNVLSEEIRAEAGQALPGLPAAISSFHGWPGTRAVTDGGTIAYVADLANKPSCDDWALILDQTPLAVEGQPSPWGDPWDCFGLMISRVSVSSTGHVAFDGMVTGPSGDRQGVVLNGAPFVLDGDVLGALFPSSVKIGPFTSAVRVDREGGLLWPHAGGLLLDKNLLVQNYVTTVGTETIEQCTIHDMSPSGDWILFRARFSSGDYGLCLYDARQAPSTYCTAGTASTGCRASIAVAGPASASATSGCDLRVGGIEAGQTGLFFFGTSGRQAKPWSNGNSFQCVIPPVRRLPVQLASGATNCRAGFVADLNQHWNVAKPQLNPGAGAVVQAQAWYRDPTNTSNQTTALSDAVEFVVAP